MPLAFRAGKTTVETISIGDEVTGFIDGVPKFGCLTPAEQIAWDKWSLSLKDGEVMSDRQIDLIAQLLSLRLKESITREQLIESVKNSKLFDLCWDFFITERMQQEPSAQLLKVTGKDGKAIANTYAKEKGAVVATRDDWEKKDTYFVVKSRGEVADDFVIVADYSEVAIADVATVGKQKQPTK